MFPNKYTIYNQIDRSGYSLALLLYTLKALGVSLSGKWDTSINLSSKSLTLKSKSPIFVFF